jgi:Putative DNA-binding domain
MNHDAFAAALLDPSLPCPPGIRTGSGAEPVARLAVHRNNVVSSLIDALADAFPVTQALVGVDFFRAMASVFVREQPPRSRLLVHFGDDLPAFIAGFEPARVLPYLADMARLERARVRAYHAGDAAPVSGQAIGAALAAVDEVGGLRLVCHPSVAVLDSAFAVASLWAAHQTGDDSDLATVDPHEAEAALVLRHGLQVLVLLLPPGFAAFYAALLRGDGLGDAAARAGEVAGPQAEAFDLVEALSLLMRHDAITGLLGPESDLP